MIQRITLDIVLVALAFTAPWWLTLTVIFGIMLYFSNFFEGIAIGVVLDSVYGLGPMMLPMMTLLSCVAFLVAVYIRQFIRV